MEYGYHSDTEYQEGDSLKLTALDRSTRVGTAYHRKRPGSRDETTKEIQEDDEATLRELLIRYDSRSVRLSFSFLNTPSFCFYFSIFRIIYRCFWYVRVGRPALFYGEKRDGATIRQDGPERIFVLDAVLHSLLLELYRGRFLPDQKQSWIHTATQPYSDKGFHFQNFCHSSVCCCCLLALLIRTLMLI